MRKYIVAPSASRSRPCIPRPGRVGHAAEPVGPTRMRRPQRNRPSNSAGPAAARAVSAPSPPCSRGYRRPPPRPQQGVAEQPSKQQDRQQLGHHHDHRARIAAGDGGDDVRRDNRKCQGPPARHRQLGQPDVGVADVRKFVGQDSAYGVGLVPGSREQSRPRTSAGRRNPPATIRALLAGRGSVSTGGGAASTAPPARPRQRAGRLPRSWRPADAARASGAAAPAPPRSTPGRQP